MKGLLIYNREGAQRNKSAVKIFTEEAEKRGIELDFSYEEEVLPPYSFDFAIMRGYDYTLSRRLEENGIRVFNSSFVSEIANDKEKTYIYLKEHGIPLMETFLYEKEKSHPIEFPFVIKPCGGHGGAGVSLVHNEAELENALIPIKNEKLIIQKVASDKGKDLRVYVIGNKIITGMLRTSDTDFRSNFSLGGRAEIHFPDEKELEVIHKVLSVFDFDYAGIDLIYHNGKPVLNEIEDVAGARMIYTHTDINIIGLFIEYIENEMRMH